MLLFVHAWIDNTFVTVLIEEDLDLNDINPHGTNHQWSNFINPQNDLDLLQQIF